MRKVTHSLPAGRFVFTYTNIFQLWGVRCHKGTEPLEKEAKERQAHGQTAPGKTLTEKIQEPSKGKSAQKAAARIADMPHGARTDIASIEAKSQTDSAGKLKVGRATAQRATKVLSKGEVIDGRNRLRACGELGVEPLTMEWEGKGSPLSFVISMNLHRRHLNESQRGMVAARIADMPQGRPSKKGQICTLKTNQAANWRFKIKRYLLADLSRVRSSPNLELFWPLKVWFRFAFNPLVKSPKTFA